MKKQFTTFLCSLVLLAAINPTSASAQENTFRLSGQQAEEIKSSVCNTRDSNWLTNDDGKFVDAIGTSNILMGCYVYFRLIQ